MSARETVIAKVLAADVLSPGDGITVALSGGADSVVLLDAVLALRERLSLSRVEAVHIQHGLRGEESRADQRFVEQLCCERGVPLRVVTCEVAALAAERGTGLEETGRAERYRVFESLAAETGNKIATAHTATDNVETVLLHVCRGSGVSGLCGIPARRGVVIRPLLACTRAEIEAYCEESGLCFVTDSTNADIRYSRNRLRRQVVPSLRQINPDIENAVARLTEQLRQTDAYLEQAATAALQEAETDGGYCRAMLQALPPVIRERVLYQLIRRVKSGYRAAHVQAADQVLFSGGSVSLPHGFCLTAVGDRVRIEHDRPPVFSCEKRPLILGEPFRFGAKVYRAVCYSASECEQLLNISNKVFPNALDYDKIDSALFVRGRLPGDSYHPAGRGCGKTFKKLFNEAALLPEERESLPIVCDCTGPVLVPGFGCDERVKITPDTKTVLVFEKWEEDSCRKC